MPAAASLHAPDADLLVEAAMGVHCPLKAPNALIADFIQYFAQRSAERGESVDTQVMRDIAHDFLQTHPLTMLSFHECRRLLNEAEGRELPPFERIVTEPLRPLFPHFGNTPSPVTPITHPLLSRRIIPGLISAISAMLGQDKTDIYRHLSERLERTHLNPITGEPNWPVILADPETHKMMTDIQVASITHFADFDRRIAWLVAMIDAHMAPVKTIQDRDWQFSERHAIALMLAFSKSLRIALGDYGSNGISQRYGPEMVSFLARFFSALDAAAHHANVSA
ncbi:MAG: hypothetical protein JXQ84_00670 [Rhodospirillaceae bacterium]|nr:hypothetical protein [Rhodospirillaceae bacterium]